MLITNYSMLEYMLMRPLERPVFDHTRQWLADNPDERFLLVVDEAHLYRGAAGAEVALLLRRLRARLGSHPIGCRSSCTSASFTTPEYAREFAAQLTGKESRRLPHVTSQWLFRAPAATGNIGCRGRWLAVSRWGLLRRGDHDSERTQAVADLLTARGVTTHARSEHCWTTRGIRADEPSRQ